MTDTPDDKYRTPVHDWLVPLIVAACIGGAVSIVVFTLWVSRLVSQAWEP